jgi:hypothetical protein
MNGGFGRGKGEDQPTVTRVDRLPAEHVAEERAVSSRVLAVQNEMDAEDHRLPKSNGGGPWAFDRRTSFPNTGAVQRYRFPGVS